MSGRVRLLLLAGVAVTGLAALSATLFPPLREAVGIAAPDRAALAASRELFAGAFARAEMGELDKHAAGAGLAVERASEGWDGLLLKEQAGACEGRGVYLLRDGDGAAPLALTAPHRGADRHTGTIAAQIFLEHDAAAAGWNSAPRRPSNACPAGLDLARAERHPFTEFALAFARQFPRGRIVQLHGFDRALRSDARDAEAGAIVSNGTAEPDAALFDLADCLSIAFDPAPVRVFGADSGDLGALGNVQGKALREAGFAGFVHLELSAELRAELAENEALRARLYQCLAGGLR